MKEIFAKNLKTLRSSLGLSQDKFGQLFDIDFRSIGTYERAICFPRISDLLIISERFKISVNDLLETDISTGNLTWVASKGRITMKNNPIKEHAVAEITKIINQYATVFFEPLTSEQ